MEKNGVPTGAYADPPALAASACPIWVTNYVLAEYGTGAVMGVPAHDERDFDFAQKHALPIAQVIVPAGEPVEAPRLDAAFVDDGVLVDSGEFDGLTSAERARDAIAAKLDALGPRKDDGQLPFPRLADLAPALLGHADPDALLRARRRWCRYPTTQLPVVLPRDVAFTGQGSPLANDRGVHEHDLPEVRRPGADATPTRWTRSSTRRGTTSATSTRTTTRAAVRHAARRRHGCRSTSTSAAPSTRSCTCSTRASSTSS